MLNHPPSPILLLDQESISKSLLGLSPAKRNPKKLQLPSTSRKHSLEGVLNHISKYKLYDKIVSTLHKHQPKIQMHYNKLIYNMNQSTLNAKKRSKNKYRSLNHSTINNTTIQKRDDIISNQYYNLKPISKTQRLTKLNPLKPKPLIFSKQTQSKKQISTLPMMKSISFKDQDINPKDKRIQDLFIKISKRQSNQFVYDISFPKRLLLDYLTQQFSPKFSSYFNWFMDLRSIIDYYYYVSLGNKFLKMDIYKIAHFTYSVFDGFSFQNSLEIFMHNYGSGDLMNIIDNRNSFKSAELEEFFNDFQKKTLNELEEEKNIARGNHRTGIKSNTLYRRTFQYKEFNGVEEVEKKEVKGETKKGEITFREFCELYATRVPNIYKELLGKLYFVEIVETEKGMTIDRKEESYNRERNGTTGSFSPKRKQKKKERWFGL